MTKEAIKARWDKVKPVLADIWDYIWDIIAGPMKVLMVLGCIVAVVATLVVGFNLGNFYMSLDYPASAFEAGKLVNDEYVIIGSNGKNTVFMEDVEGNRYVTTVAVGEQYRAITLSNIKHAAINSTTTNKGIYVITFEDGTTIIS